MPSDVMSDEVEVAGGQACLRHILERDHVCRVLGDDQVRPDLGGMSKRGGEIGKYRVVQLNDVVARSRRQEIGDHFLAEVGREHEGVVGR